MIICINQENYQTRTQQKELLPCVNPKSNKQTDNQPPVHQKPSHLTKNKLIIKSKRFELEGLKNERSFKGKYRRNSSDGNCCD